VSIAHFFRLILAGEVALALTACGGSGGSSPAMPAQASSVRVRFMEGAPELDAIIGSQPQSIGNAYLRVDGQTVASSFNYGTLTSYATMPSVLHSLTARDLLGYAVGPIKIPALTAGTTYTLIVVGSYPKYSVLAFPDPTTGSGAQLSLYEASPTVPQAAFGTFTASTKSNFKQRGSAKFGNVATVTIGKSVSNIGGYVGRPSNALGQLTLAQIDPHDKHNVLPFHVATRLSLFLLDPGTGSPSGPVFGNLDR
jgi:hypothetical protein